MSPSEVLITRFKISPKETETPSEEVKIFVNVSLSRKAISSMT